MNSDKLGTEKIEILLLEQAVPAAVGFLVMSIYMIVDTIFIGHWVGPMGIAAITVVLPISFLIASVGMSIGIGGASMISRALGANEKEYAGHIFGNQIVLILLLSSLVLSLGFSYEEALLRLFGAKGAILPYAKAYFKIILIGVPCLSWAMMSNHIIRAEGYPKIAMNVMLIPAIVNLILDPIFIYGLEMGMEGAALATILSQALSALYTLWFFVFGKSDLRIQLKKLVLKVKIVIEIASLGVVSLARQGVISLLMIVLNNALYLRRRNLYFCLWDY